MKQSELASSKPSPGTCIRTWVKSLAFLSLAGAIALSGSSVTPETSLIKPGYLTLETSDTVTNGDEQPLSPHSIQNLHTVFLLAGGRSASETDVANAVGSLGRVQGKDKATGFYVIALQEAGDAAKAIEVIKHRLHSELVFPYDIKQPDQGSLHSVERYLDFFEEMQRSRGKGGAASEGADYFEALKYFLEYRANKQGYIDQAIYRKAVAHRDQMMSAAPKLEGKIAGKWAYVGPVNLGVPYQRYYGSTPPSSGRVTSIAYGSVDKRTIYIGTGGGGVWKTTDGGVTWACMSDTPEWKYSAVSCIAVDPTNLQTIYAGTGDYHGFFNFYNQGIMKSTDGGLTWRNYGLAEFGDQTVSHIVVDPQVPNVVIATTGNGAGNQYGGYIWRSTNGGVTWSRCVYTNAYGGGALPNATWSGFAYSLEISRYYAAAGAADGILIFTSSDFGATWEPLQSPINVPDDYVSIVPSRSGGYSSFHMDYFLLSAGTRNMFVNNLEGTGLTAISQAGFPNTSDDGTMDNWYQNNYDYYIGSSYMTEPGGAHHDVIYVGLITIAQAIVSLNGDNTLSFAWSDIGRSFNSVGSIIHNDQHCYAIAPGNNDEGLFGNDAGLYHFVFDPGSRTYTFNSLNRNIGTTQFYAIAPHPTDPNRILGGTQDEASAGAFGDLSNWSGLQAGDGGYCAWDVAHNVYYTTGNQHVYRYYSNGTFDDITAPGGFAAPIAFIPPMVLANDGTPMVGSFQLRKYVSGNNWASLGPIIGGIPRLTSTNTGTVRSMATCPSADGILYTGSTDGAIWETTDLGATQAGWHQVGQLTASNGVAVPVGAISPNPNNANDILVGIGLPNTNVHLIRCLDTSKATVWTPGDPGGPSGLPQVPVNAIQRDPYDPDNVWYVGTDVGVFMTDDAGATWTNMTRPLGLPNTLVFDLKIGAGYLYAGTFGRGIWRIKLVAPTSLSSLTLSNPEVFGGEFLSGTVTVTNAPGSTGFNVALKSSHPAATVPANAFIGPTAISQTFTINTVPVAIDVSVKITASMFGKSKIAALKVKAPILATFTLPSAVIGGLKATGTITISSKAPPNGAAVLLTSNNANAIVSSKLTIPSGAVTANFTVTTKAVPATTVAKITATLNGSTLSKNLSVIIPPVKSIVFSPNPAVGGSAASCAVTLSALPYAAGITVGLSSNNSSAVPPASVKIAGALSNTVAVTTLGVDAATVATISATQEGHVTKTATLTLNPANILSLKVPTSAVGGSSPAGTVRLNGFAGPSGKTAYLTSSLPGVVSVPASVFLSPQTSTKGFILTTKPVNSSTAVTISARVVTTKTATIRVDPPSLYSLTISPASVVGGSNSYGTVRLNGSVGSSGKVILLSSNSSLAVVPASIKISTGYLGKFTIATKHVTTQTAVTLTAKDGTIVKTVQLTLMP